MNLTFVFGAVLTAATVSGSELERRADILCDSFGISSERSVIGPNDLGMANGHVTVNGYYLEVDEVRGIYAPPYYSNDFRLCVSFNGKGVSAQSYFWRPERLTRTGTNDAWKVTSDLVLADGRRGGMVRYVVTNIGRVKNTLELKWWHLGKSAYQKDWGFTKPKASDTGESVFALASSLGAENVAVSFKDIAAGESITFAIAFALGAPGENEALVSELVANPAATMSAVQSGWRTRVRALAEKMPWFESDDQLLNRLYRRSLLHLLINEWNVPEFKLHPYYATGGVNGGCICNYLWNYGGPYKIWPILNPKAAKAHLDTFLGVDLEKSFFFYPMDGRGGGLYYMINQEKIVFLIDALAREYGGADFLNQRFGDLTYAEWAQKMALTHDDLTKDAVLHDYGESNAHLELRTGVNLYNGVMPDLNLRRIRLLRMADRLMKWAGQTPKADLAKRANDLRDLCRRELWDENVGWFRARCHGGSTQIRWTMQMFKAFGCGAFDADVEAKMLAHLMNPSEFLGDYGIHSLAKTDSAYDVSDVDNGGPGACPSFAPAICDRLYEDGHVEEANSIFMRLKWLADALPYWGDSQYADRKDYRRDTPLQSDIEGAALAQTMIFGLFGINIDEDGNVTSTPHLPNGVKWMTLDNLRVRGKTYSFNSSEQSERKTVTAELQARIDAASAQGGGTVSIVAGRYKVAQLQLKSNVTLSLAKDAVLEASTDYRDYAVENVPRAPEGRLAVVCAYGATNIALVGEGRLVGHGDAQTVRKGNGDDRWRMIHFRECDGVRVEGISIRDSNFWCSFYERCRHVAIRRVKIFSHANSNNDGMDLEVADSLVEDCDIDCGDDAICFKSHDPAFVIENVEIRNCRVASQCNFVKFGTAGRGTYRDIDIHNCTLRRPSPERLHDWSKTGRLGVTDGRWGISAIALEVVDGGSMERVKIRDIDIEGGPQNPLFVRLARRTSSDGRKSFIRDILIDGIRWKTDDPTLAAVLPIVIMGTPDLPVGIITVRNMSIPFKALKRPVDERRCRVVNRDAEYPEVIHISEYYPSWATYLEYAPAVIFENCDFRRVGEGDERPMRNERFASEQIRPEFLGLAIAPDDIETARRSDALALMREMGVGIVRWPVGTDEMSALGACDTVGAEASFTVDPLRESAENLVARLAKCNRRVTRWLMASESAKTEFSYVRSSLEKGEAMLKSDCAFPLRLVTDGAYPKNATEQTSSRIKPFHQISNCASIRSYATLPVTRARPAADAISVIDKSFAELCAMRETAPPWLRLSLDSINLHKSLLVRDEPVNGVVALHALHRIFGSHRKIVLDHACPFSAFGGGAMVIQDGRVRLTAVGEAFRLSKGHVGGVPIKDLTLPDNVFATTHGDHRYYTMFNADGRNAVEIFLPEGDRIKLSPYEIRGMTRPTRRSALPRGTNATNGTCLQQIYPPP